MLKIIFCKNRKCADLMTQQEAQGLDALLDKMADNDHIKLDTIEI